ncbi:MAG: aminoacyl-histidine dipeptidase [Firmicutes bacterium]|nr:aminoacyl-histidine dipeptidase [Bacillota bacterium]
MGVLSDLEPKNVFRFFEEIAGIPHGSGNVGQISDYLADFARERNLFFIQDELKNVIIVKEATPGYEQEPGVILQGHMDMVAVKKPDCSIDMKKEGLQLAVDGDKIYAKGTSLGGDDGIAVAYSLALLDSDTISHPKLEVIITVDEEVGMDGARGIDLSMLTGSRMINLDSEEEGIFLTSCAGGARVKCRVPLEKSMKVTNLETPGGSREAVSGGGAFAENAAGSGEYSAYEVTVGGLLGGHSGGEIHKERGNSNCLFGRLLGRLCEKMPVALVKVQGGLADNAIPRETRGTLAIREKDSEAFASVLDTVEKEIRAELSVKDPGVFIKAEKKGQCDLNRSAVEGTKRAADFLCGLPNGVQAMSADMPGLVETSLNLGILEYEEVVSGEFLAEFSVRSSIESAKNALIGKLRAVTKLAGGTVTVTGDYPGWRFRKDSPLREKMIRVYDKMYGKAPAVEAIHAGLECGILGSKIPDLDCVSIGPDMRDIHTTEETLSISSTGRVWEYLVRLLGTKDGEKPE